VGVDRGCV